MPGQPVVGPVRHEYADETVTIGEYRFRHTGYRYDRGRIYRYQRPIYPPEVQRPPETDTGLLVWDCYYIGSYYRSPDGMFSLSNGEHVGQVIADHGLHYSLGGNKSDAMWYNSSIPYGYLSIPDCKFRLGSSVTIPQTGFYGFDYAIINAGFCKLYSYNYYANSSRGGGIKIAFSHEIALEIHQTSLSAQCTELYCSIKPTFKSRHSDKKPIIKLGKYQKIGLTIDSTPASERMGNHPIIDLSTCTFRNMPSFNTYPLEFITHNFSYIDRMKFDIRCNIDFSNSYRGKLRFYGTSSGASSEISNTFTREGNFTLKRGLVGDGSYTDNYNRVDVFSKTDRCFNLIVDFSTDSSRQDGNLCSVLKIEDYNHYAYENINFNLVLNSKISSTALQSVISGSFEEECSVEANCEAFVFNMSNVNIRRLDLRVRNGSALTADRLRFNIGYNRPRRMVLELVGNGVIALKNMDLSGFTGSKVLIDTPTSYPKTAETKYIIKGNKNLNLYNIWDETTPGKQTVIFNTSEDTNSWCTINNIKLKEPETASTLDYMVRGPNTNKSYIDGVEFKGNVKIRGCPKFTPSSNYSIKVYGARLIDGNPTFKHRCTVKDVFLITDNASLEDDAIAGGNFKLAGTAIVGGRMNINVKPPITESPESNRDAAAFSLYFGEYRYNWTITEAYQIGNVIDPYGNVIYFYRESPENMYVVVNDRSVSFKSLAATLLQEIGAYKESETRVPDPVTDPELIRKREEIRKLAIAYKLANDFLSPFCKTKGFDLTVFEIDPVALFKC